MPDDTKTLEAMCYVYDIRIITSGSCEYTTEVESLTLEEVVIRAT